MRSDWKWCGCWWIIIELFKWLMNLNNLRYEIPWIKCCGLPPRVPGWKLDTLLTLRRKCVTGHYINSRECYPHWAILIIWEKSMHRLLGMHVGGQSKDNSDLSGWLDNRQMSLISHRTGMHHIHLYALLGFELVLVCLIAKLFLIATWTICCNCYLLVLSLSVLPVFVLACYIWEWTLVLN